MGIQEWIAGVAIKKGVGSAVKLIVSMVTAAAIAGPLEQMGVKIDQVQLTAGLTILINSGLRIAQNYLKVKYGWKFLG